MRILITGINGFVGSHLAEYCAKQKDAEVYGTVLPGQTPGLKNAELLECDLTKKESIEDVILKVKPDKIFHLAGQSQVSASFQDPEKTLLNNILSDLNIFEASKKMEHSPVIVIAGSSDEYGLTFKEELPIKEDNPFRPLSTYAVSKITQEKLGFQYCKSYGLKIVLMRFFNTEGPGRGEQFVTSTFAKQISEIEKGLKEPIIYAGNLDAQRDFVDVRDVVRAYWLASEKCKLGEPYNICSGTARSIKSVLDILLNLSTEKNIQIKQDTARMRPSDIPIIVGDNSKFKKETGWEPEIPFEKTMEDLLNYWRNK